VEFQDEIIEQACACSVAGCPVEYIPTGVGELTQGRTLASAHSNFDPGTKSREVELQRGQVRNSVFASATVPNALKDSFTARFQRQMARRLATHETG
jgi:hypothetical protein